MATVRTFPPRAIGQMAGMAACALALLAGCTAVPSRAPVQPAAKASRPAPRTPSGAASQASPAALPQASAVPPPPATGFRAPQVFRSAGLEGVIEADAESLIRQFGTPRLDVTEGDMRKLQFAGQPCVLDLFLYPLREGGKPVATYLDARRASDGLDVDRRACVDALRRR